MTVRQLSCAVLVLMAQPLSVSGVSGEPLSSTAFTYQGYLEQSGQPVSNQCDFKFSLWTDSNNPQPGTQLGSDLALTSSVNDGVFSALLDFDTAILTSEARWLQIAVCCASPCSPGYTDLSPRQPITAAPYSIQTRGIQVNDAGDVGIGTSTPAAKLHVAGDLKVDGNAEASGDVLGGSRLCIGADCRSEWPDGVGGNGVTSIAAGTGLTASPENPITTAGTLAFDQAYGDGRYARLGSVNTFTANQNVDATLTVSKPAGNAIEAIGNSAGGIGVETSGFFGLFGTSTAPSFGVGVAGDGGASGTGVQGLGLTGVFGQGHASTGGIGVYGLSASATGSGGVFKNSDPGGKIISGLSAADAEVFTVAGTGNVGFGTASPSFATHLQRNEATASGLQSRITNTATSGHSFATFSAAANNDAVVSLFAADGLGTGPLATPGAYLGTYSSAPLGLVTGNVERVRITPAGRVGVGITNPAFPLDVEGDIRFGEGIKVLAAGSTESLRIIRGQVNADGTCGEGSGFTCSHLGVGWYEVTFNLAFPSTPAVTATRLAAGGVYLAIITLGGISTTSFTIQIYDKFDNGNPQDNAFTFIAMGPI